ncbi:substrate-binding domain-containing protein [Nocardioides marmoribigeumensis]|uniref:Fructose transport system substrate-binding protein n=1 Tax=Nocardioides marmoribigeumensis TaxID=433649 RepID=A0ABU2C1G1_9ACTN|nr:substrate-binding domain-containing protein [Nocardioides marmoribigeumensis]MDR7364506.1 fructose transport system substrate-binding protein [Nocardioides marmoribigeumensis]
MRRRRTARGIAGVVGLLAASTLVAACGGNGDKTGVSLILKTQTNPYFVSMKNAALEQARAADVHLSVASGTADGDTQNQINAIDTAIARGDAGILITSNGPAVNAALRQAKDFGLFVIALDTPLDPIETADVTYATDNFQAGKLIGEYAAARLDGKKAVIAMLDLYDDQVVSVDIERDHGFLSGMGIDPGSKNLNGREKKSGSYKSPTGGKGGKYQIACHQATQGAIDGGRSAMEQCLSRNPGINVVYTINEPAGEGAHAALSAAGKADRVLIVSIDGSCKGMDDVDKGIFAADATQYPGKMAALGVKAVAAVGAGDRPPSLPEGKDFLDTGTRLVTADPVKGLKSQTVEQGRKACWGG